MSAAVPCSFPETRTQITRYLPVELIPDTQTLGFTAQDVYEVSREGVYDKKLIKANKKGNIYLILK